MAATTDSYASDPSTTYALPLRKEFQRGQALYQKLENSELASSDPAFQEDVTEGINSLLRCAALVETLGVFSSNELLEDINTADLRYLLVNAYLAELISKRMGQDRTKVLQTAQHHYERFLAACEQHEILRADDKKFLETQMKGGIADPEKKRMEKIARYKREKATKEKLKELHEQLSYQAKANPNEDEDVDEELDREIILTTIDLFIQRTGENLKLIQDERKLLEMAKAKGTLQGPDSRDPSTIVEGTPPRMNHQGPLLASDGKILRPFVITSKREALRQQVFRPGHNLPTMTVEEYIDKEIERGNFLSGGGKEPETKIVDDNDHEALDAETFKARQWDEFKDDTPRGWGNRYNKG
ncbi:hypothetical protein SpCBS45565_g03920 [Spizellomyces sp. 'palustris']|nr:hypothetical protein SpCBS45565_g03920 [Spizellomyces sp. 'palustris']